MFAPSVTIARVSLAIAAAVWLVASPLPASAADRDTVSAGVSSSSGARFLALGIGKSTVIDLPRDAKDVLVANPAIANAVVRSARRAYLIGVAAGQTNVIFFDAEGRQMAAYDIEVGRDASGVREALRRLMPNSSVRVDAVNDSVVLSGEVDNAAQAQHAVDAAAKLVGDAEKVVNGLTIRGGEQVMLKVTVAEVERNVLKQFGINMSGSVGIGSAVVGFQFDNPFHAQSGLSNQTNLFPVVHGLEFQYRCPDSRDGAIRRASHARGTEPHGDFRRVGEVSGRRRVSGPNRQHLRSPALPCDD
jgi:pilus assembly protein CpaC